MLRRGFAIVATAVVVGGALDSAAISATVARAGRLSDGFSVADHGESDRARVRQARELQAIEAG